MIRQHAQDFIAKREAPAFIPNDGKQTPMKGHPVFIAQHSRQQVAGSVSENGIRCSQVGN